MAVQSRWVAGLVAVVAVVCGCGSSVSGSGTASGHSSTPASTPTTAYRTVTSTVTAPAPSSSTSSPAASTPAGSPVVPSDFVGTWYGHGRTLTVTAGGAFDVVYRTYVNCTATVTTDCDKTVGNEIEDGGRITAQLATVVNPTTVTVTVTARTASSQVPLGPVRVGFDQGHDAIALFAGSWASAPFCGPSSPGSYCGA